MDVRGDIEIIPTMLKPKKKVTDFSINAIMAERDDLISAVSDGKTGFRRVRSPSTKLRESISPRSTAETPDTTTSDDLLLASPYKKDKPCSPELAGIHCLLEAKDLWERFNELGTEMIITRSGRRMFPTIRASFSGLDPKASYLILMDIVTVDSKRYRYAYHRSSWLVAGKGDPAHHSKLYAHPDSPFLGTQLSKQMITFEKVKLTNTDVNKPGYISLNSMHRYQPRIHLVLDTGDEGFSKSLKTYSDLQNCNYKTFVFPECAFYSVTAYQNQLITKLKIDCNPFAKGFRDSTRVISEMERESMNSSGMMPDSTMFCPYSTLPPHESMSDLDAVLLSQKLAQIPRMIPGFDRQFMKNFSGPQNPAMPFGLVQRWSLAGWSQGMQVPGLDQRQFLNLAMNPAELSRQLMLAKQMPTGPFHPYYGIDPQDFVQRYKDGSSPEK